MIVEELRIKLPNEKACRCYLESTIWKNGRVCPHCGCMESWPINRPQLQAALSLCTATGATLLVSKLDRLSLNAHFITQLQKDGFLFVAADMPNADSFMTQIYAAVAQQERKMISERTKAGLQAAKVRGVKLGGNRGKLTPEQQAKASRAGASMMRIRADAFAEQVAPIIKSLQQQGLSLGKIAKTFNHRWVNSPPLGAIAVIHQRLQRRY